MSDHRKELAWASTLIIILLGALSWFFVSMIGEMKQQNISQWQVAGRTKDCMQEEIAKLRERVAFLEGTHGTHSEREKK